MQLIFAFLLYFSFSMSAFASGSPAVLLVLGGVALILFSGFVALGLVKSKPANKVRALLVLVAGTAGVWALGFIPDYEQNHLILDAAALGLAVAATSLSLWIQGRK